MLAKINVRGIVADHIQTLRAYDTGKTSWPDLVLFLLVPLLIAALLVRVLPSLTPDFVRILATSLSIFAALLFNLNALMYGIVIRRNEEHRRGPLRQQVIQEIYNNVAFCILIAVVTLALLLMNFFIMCSHWLALGIALLVYYLVGVFMLTLLMVLKRIHVLLRHEATET